MLVANALAVLHPRRFLRHYNLDASQLQNGIEDPNALRAQIANTLRAARTSSSLWVLIMTNVLVIVVELIFG